MKTFEEIKSEITKMCQEIGLERKDAVLYDSVQTDGTPFIQLIDNKYLYISKERGEIIFVKETKNVKDLYFWIMDDLISNFSYKYELNHRVEGKDFRRLIFKKQIQYFEMICDEWKVRKEKDIQYNLMNSPFND